MKFNLPARMALDICHIWQNTKNEQENTELSYAPDHTVKLTIKKTLDIGTRLTMTLKGVSEQYTDNRNTVSEKSPSYTTAGAQIVDPVKLLGHTAEFFIHLQNLLDEKFASHYGYPDDGFRFQCGLNIDL